MPEENPLPWYRGKLLALDLETTGTDVHSDRIITASLVFVPAALRPQTATWWIDPGIEIPPEAAAVHGWTRPKLQAHPKVMDPADALFQLVGRLALAMTRQPDMPLVVFNAAFDLTMLEAECRRHGVDPLSTRLERGIRPVVDPFVLDKQASRRRGPRKLANQCEHYGVLLGDAHQAYADALAACRVLTRLCEQYPGMGSVSPDRLHDMQVGWRASQMKSLREYFDRKGTEHDGCCGEWPVHAECAPVSQGVLL